MYKFTAASVPQVIVPPIGPVPNIDPSLTTGKYAILSDPGQDELYFNDSVIVENVFEEEEEEEEL